MSDDFAEGAVCIPNIGPRERAKRMRFGVVMGAVSAVAAGALVVLHAPRVASLAVFVPAFLAGLGVFQAREQT